MNNEWKLTCNYEKCLNTENLMVCSICREACYCSEKCQSYDWPVHKITCASTIPESLNKLITVRRENQDNWRPIAYRPCIGLDNPSHFFEDNNSIIDDHIGTRKKLRVWRRIISSRRGDASVFCINCYEVLRWSSEYHRTTFRRGEFDVSFIQCASCAHKCIRTCSTHLINVDICQEKEINAARNSFMAYLLCVKKTGLIAVNDVKRLIWRKIIDCISSSGKCYIKTLEEIDAASPEKPANDMPYVTLAKSGDIEGDRIFNHPALPKIAVDNENMLQWNC